MTTFIRISFTLWKKKTFSYQQPTAETVFFEPKQTHLDEMQIDN